MLAKMYAVRNVTTGVWDIPFPAMNHGEAKKMFENAMKGLKVLRNNEEFDLWHIGIYNQDKGTFKRRFRNERIQ